MDSQDIIDPKLRRLPISIDGAIEFTIVYKGEITQVLSVRGIREVYYHNNKNAFAVKYAAITSVHEKLIRGECVLDCHEVQDAYEEGHREGSKVGFESGLQMAKEEWLERLGHAVESAMDWFDHYTKKRLMERGNQKGVRIIRRDFDPEEILEAESHRKTLLGLEKKYSSKYKENIDLAF